MPFNGSGGFDPLTPPTYPAVAGDTIFASRFNSIINDILAGLGAVVTRNGQSPATANLPMGGFKHTGAADATAAGQYLVYGQTAVAALSRLTLSGSADQLAIQSSASNVRASIRFDQNSVAKGYIGPDGGAQLITGAADGDFIIRASGASAGNLRFNTSAGGASTQMLLDTLGRLTVSAPSSGRHTFNVNSGTAGALEIVNGTNAVLAVSDTAGATRGIIAWAGGAMSVYNSNNGSLNIGTNSDPNMLTIGSNGNVSVKTSVSGYSLAVGGAMALNSNGATLDFTNTGAGVGQINYFGSSFLEIVPRNAAAGVRMYYANAAGPAFTLDNTGHFTFAASSSGATLDVSQNSTGPAIRTTLSNNAGTNAWHLVNTSNTAGSDALMFMSVGGSSAGDAFIRFNISGSEDWSFGIDNSDGDALVFSRSSSPGGTNRFRLSQTAQHQFTGGAYTSTVASAFSATPTFDAALSNVFEMGALTANVTSITIANPANGQTISIRMQQDGTGGRTVAVPTGAKVSGSVGSVANAASILTLTYSPTGGRWEGAWVQLPV